MFNRNANRKPSANNGDNHEVREHSAVLRMIGDRSAGKTTYIAALVRHPSVDSTGSVQTVTAVNQESIELAVKAQNILEQGLEPEPTDLSPDADNVKDYSLTVTLKDQRSLLSASLTRLNVSCKDYAGEFFADVLHQSDLPQFHNYLGDCVSATGILFLIDGTAYRKDLAYADGIEKFLIALSRAEDKPTKRRVALVLTKCEQPELWLKRHQPQQLAATRFPKVHSKLQSWQTAKAGDIAFFATSAFGTLGTRYPEPNAKQLHRSQGGITSVLKEPKRWRPFGLVAPLYWLCTGEQHPQLTKD